MTSEDFAVSVERLLKQVGHWEQSRWSATVQAPATHSRAEVVHGLAQQLADLAADAEGNPRRPVPRVGDLTLPDQVKVTADDLFLAGVSDDAFKLATDKVNAVRRAL